MEQKTLVIFDVDDTLLNSMRMDSRAFAMTFKNLYDHTLPTIDWSTYPHVTDTTIFNTAYSRVFDELPSVEEVSRFRNEFVDLMMNRRTSEPDSFQEIPGALAIVELLLSLDDYLVGVATGGWMLPAVSKLNYKGFDLSDIYASYADGKDTREAILTESLYLAQEAHGDVRAVYIGDAIWDIKTTRNLNMDFIGIRHRGDTEVLENQGATQVIEDYLNIQGFLQMVDQATPPLKT